MGLYGIWPAATGGILLFGLLQNINVLSLESWRHLWNLQPMQLSGEILGKALEKSGI